MNFSTENARGSMLGLPPIADGALDKHDAMQLLGLPSGNALITSVFLTGGTSETELTATFELSFGREELLTGGTSTSTLTATLNLSKQAYFAGQSASELVATFALSFGREELLTGGISASELTAAFRPILTRNFSGASETDLTAAITLILTRMLSGSSDSELIATLALGITKNLIQGRSNSVVTARLNLNRDGYTGMIARY